MSLLDYFSYFTVKTFSYKAKILKYKEVTHCVYKSAIKIRNSPKVQHEGGEPGGIIALCKRSSLEY